MHNGSVRIARAFVFAVALATLVAMAYLSNRAWRDLLRSRAEGLTAIHAAQVNARILGWVRDAETGQRGYLLTGRAEYLAPYRHAVDEIDSDLKELRALLSNDAILASDPQSLRRIDTLEQLISAKFEELRSTIEARDQRGQAAAMAIIESNRGQELMNQVRAVCQEIETATDRQLDLRREEISRESSDARLVTLGGAGLLFLILLLFYWLNERYSGQREDLIAQVAAARDLLGTTLYSIAEGVIATDVNGAVQMMNGAAERLTGISEANARRKPVEEVFQIGASDRGSWPNPVREVLEGRVGQPSAAPLRLETGRMVEATASPIRGAGGELRGAVLVFRDIGARLDSEQRLRQTAKLESLGVLAGGIAHDFNNLLVGIVGGASMLEEYVSADGGGRELLRTLQSSADRASRLTHQLLAYSGRGAFMVRTADLSGEVRAIATLLRSSIPSNVELRLNLAEGLPQIHADSGQLQQLVMNLVINGAEAVGAAPGVVEVETTLHELTPDAVKDALGNAVPAGAYVRLAVRDTGHGMDEATKSRIFDPFFTTKFTGRGLGLASALGIVKGHGAAIEVQTSPGKGSTFHVYFPQAETARDVVTDSAAAVN